MKVGVPYLVICKRQFLSVLSFETIISYVTSHLFFRPKKVRGSGNPIDPKKY